MTSFANFCAFFVVLLALLGPGATTYIAYITWALVLRQLAPKIAFSSEKSVFALTSGGDFCAFLVVLLALLGPGATKYIACITWALVLRQLAPKIVFFPRKKRFCLDQFWPTSAF